MLEVINAKKKYGSKEVLKDINFTLAPGQIKGLVGPNGSGKTTLFKYLTNGLDQTQGQVLVDGQAYEEEKIFHKVSFFKDEKILDGELFGMDYLAYIGRVYGKSSAEVQEVIDEIEIDDFVRTKIKTYSLGMKKKLMLAMAILPGNAYCLLDEPISGLDPTSVERTKNYLKEKAQAGMAFIISPHQLKDLDDITNDILFLKEGVLIEEELKKKKTLHLFTDQQERLRSLLAELGYAYQDQRLVLEEEREVNVILEALNQAGIKVLEISMEVQSSQERYNELFREAPPGLGGQGGRKGR